MHKITPSAQFRPIHCHNFTLSRAQLPPSKSRNQAFGRGEKGTIIEKREKFPTDILHNSFFCLHLHHSFGEILQKLFGQEGWVSG